MRFLCVIITLFLCVGCASTPVVKTEEKQQDMWWKAFNDPVMEVLAEQLLAENIDIKIAASRIEESRALTRMTTAGLFPELRLAGDANRGNNQIGSPKPITRTLGRVDGSFDVDIFGRKRADVSASQARGEAAVANFKNVQNEMLSELFRAVIAWRQAEQSLCDTNNLLVAYQEQVAIFSDHVKTGLTNASSLERARAQAEQTAAELPQITARSYAAEYQIARLLGKDTEALAALLAQHKQQDISIPSVGKTLEIDIKTLQNRPDIRAAKALMLASQADLKSAEAALWPSLNLNGFYGVQDVSQGVVTAGNPIWFMASSLSMPLLNFGRLRGAIDSANAKAAQASLNYENTVALALQETRTALSDYLQGVNAISQIETALKYRRNTVDLAKERFEHGLTDMVDLTTATAELEQTTLMLTNQKAQTAIAYIRLQKALQS